MTIYVFQLGLIITLALFFDPNSEKGRNRYIIAVAIILASVSSLRAYTVGVDTLQFVDAYSRTSFEGSRYEPGFILLIRLLNAVFGSNPQALVISTSCFITFSIAWAIKRCDCNAVVAYFLYITLLAYAANMNLMRQALAASFILLAIPCLMNGRYLKYLFAVVLASLFHSSALVMLVLLPLSFVEPGRKTIIAYFAVTAAMFMTPGSIWDFVTQNFEQYESYSRSKWAGGNELAAPIMTVMDIALLYASWHVNEKANEKSNESLRVLFHGAMLQIVFQALACTINIFQRLTTFTSFLLILYFASVFKDFKTRERFLFLYFTLGISVAFFAIVMVFRPQWYGVVPFSFFWN